MKRLILAIVIIILIIITSFCGISVIQNTGHEVENRIKEIQKTAFTGTTGKAEDFFYYWENQRETMAIFVNHNDIDEIGKLAARMVSAERSENSLDVFESANEILFIIRGIEENERFTFFTLL